MTRLVDRKCICSRVVHEKLYSKEFDTDYCKSCNSWLEDKCDDINCEYCINRPLFPNDYQPIEKS